MITTAKVRPIPASQGGGWALMCPCSGMGQYLNSLDTWSAVICGRCGQEIENPQLHRPSQYTPKDYSVYMGWDAGGRYDQAVLILLEHMRAMGIKRAIDPDNGDYIDIEAALKGYEE